jgi:hypothetical protein
VHHLAGMEQTKDRPVNEDTVTILKKILLITTFNINRYHITRMFLTFLYVK